METNRKCFKTFTCNVSLGEYTIAYIWSMLHWMMFAVVRPIGQFKVFNSIVQFVSVFVVNNLKGFQAATKMRFHHLPMFQDSSTTSSKQPVAIPCNSPRTACRPAEWFGGVSVSLPAQVVPIAKRPTEHWIFAPSYGALHA